MKISVEIEVDPGEFVSVLQRLADADGTHEAGPNSKVKVGESIVPMLNSQEKDHAASQAD